jgi:hypothetical protein
MSLSVYPAALCYPRWKFTPNAMKTTCLSPFTPVEVGHDAMFRCELDDPHSVGEGQWVVRAQ